MRCARKRLPNTSDTSIGPGKHSRGSTCGTSHLPRLVGAVLACTPLPNWAQQSVLDRGAVAASVAMRKRSLACLPTAPQAAFAILTSFAQSHSLSIERAEDLLAQLRPQLRRRSPGAGRMRWGQHDVAGFCEATMGLSRIPVSSTSGYRWREPAGSRSRSHEGAARNAPTMRPHVNGAEHSTRRLPCRPHHSAHAQSFGPASRSQWPSRRAAPSPSPTPRAARGTTSNRKGKVV